MLIARDAENDRLAAALVAAFRPEETSVETGYDEGLQPLHASLEPKFYGAGGPQMAAAGVELICGMDTPHNNIKGFWSAHQAFEQLHRVALEREPHAIIFVGYQDFNLRFARAIKHYVRDRRGTFNNWDPVIFQVGAPMRWSSQPSRVRSLRGNIDYLLSTISLEKNVDSSSPLDVKFVGNPGNATGIPVIARRAAHAIVEVLTERETRFPLRGYLSAG